MLAGAVAGGHTRREGAREGKTAALTVTAADCVVVTSKILKSKG